MVPEHFMTWQIHLVGEESEMSAFNKIAKVDYNQKFT